MTTDLHLIFVGFAIGLLIGVTFWTLIAFEIFKSQDRYWQRTMARAEELLKEIEELQGDPIETAEEAQQYLEGSMIWRRHIEELDHLDWDNC